VGEDGQASSIRSQARTRAVCSIGSRGDPQNSIPLQPQVLFGETDQKRDVADETTPKMLTPPTVAIFRRRGILMRKNNLGKSNSPSNGRKKREFFMH
jgi:hypothetical protein